VGLTFIINAARALLAKPLSLVAVCASS